jgi:sarcosine oxidase gamma subunit
MQRRKPPDILAATHDALGRLVVLTQERWEGHILVGHSDMEGLELAVMRAIENADRTRPGKRPGRQELYAQGLGPARWLVVVVDYSDTPAWVVTAHPMSKDPKFA